MYEVKCPFCNYINSMEAEDLPWNDEQETDRTCTSCDREFVIIADVRISHEGVKPEDMA